MVRTPRLQLGNAVVTRRYGRRRSSYRLGEGRSEANDSVDAVICGSKDLRRSLCVMRCSANLLARTSTIRHEKAVQSNERAAARDWVDLCRNKENTLFANGLMRFGSKTGGQTVEGRSACR